eukprot:3199323-Prymnesium_polylepis.1
MLVCAGVSPGPRVTPGREKDVEEVECGADTTGTQEGRCPIRTGRPLSPDQRVGHTSSTHMREDTDGLTRTRTLMRDRCR